MEDRHRKIARVALGAAGKFSLALAGAYAIQAHGIGSRPSGDVDLFVNWACRDDFNEAMNTVIAALEAEGMEVTVVAQAQTFARLLVTDPAAGGEPDKVEVAADWRSHEPVTLEIGPVLHADDAVANKMAALYGRALARDFLDVDAILASGRYSRERLLELAAAADEGFDRQMFADALRALTQITDAAFTEYGVRAEDITSLRHRFAAWRDSLLTS